VDDGESVAKDGDVRREKRNGRKQVARRNLGNPFHASSPAECRLNRGRHAAFVVGTRYRPAV